MVAETKPLKSGPLTIPNRGRAGWIPESIRLTVRSFYVLQGLGPSQIAPMVGLSAIQVRNLCVREGWSKLRVAKDKSKAAKTVETQNARASADIQRVVEAVAIRSEELSVRTLERCSDLLDARDDKGLQMASGAARNFVQIARLSRGLDRSAGGPGSGSAGDGAPSLAVFMVRGEPVERLMEQAQVVNVEAREAKAIAAPAAGT